MRSSGAAISKAFREADIARVLKISSGTVKKATHRAMVALRVQLGADWEDHLAVTSES